MWTAFKRIVRSGVVGFWRNAFVSLTAIYVMSITLFVIGVVLFMSALLNESLVQLQQKVDINVYFATSAEEEEILALQNSLETLPEVAEVTYTSRSEALERFRERYQNDETIVQALEELGENPLRASLAIRATETSQYEGIAAFLVSQQEARDPNDPLLDNVNFYRNEEAINRLTAIINAVEQFGYAAMGFLVAAAVLIMFNTVRLAIYTSREEIGVMRLVGAGNMFIRGPFVLQGVMYGLVSGIIVLLLFYPLTLWVAPITESFFLLNLFNYYTANFGFFFLVIVGTGIVLGAISSAFAIARHLRI